MEKQELLVQINKLKDTIKEIEEILHRDDVKTKKFVHELVFNDPIAKLGLEYKEKYKEQYEKALKQQNESRHKKG